jgi:SAM-dependent methyltransferase
MADNLRTEDIFFEIHRNLPRQGPGDSQSTARAFFMLPELPPEPRILDVGCGPGMQTRDLLRLSRGTVYAVDTHFPFLEELWHNLRSEAATSRRMRDAQGRLIRILASMSSLPFCAQAFDLIWSEGAIYIMGFDQGLTSWRPHIRPGGCLVVSEISWFKADAPPELRSFWASMYPAMRSVEANLEAVQEAGYQVVGHFVLPAASWWPNYYAPLQERVRFLRDKYRSDPETLRLLDEEQQEIELFRRYSAWYGYVFYVARRPSGD